MKLEIWHAFVLGAVLSWGIYVPVLHEGQSTLGGNKPSEGALRAFLCVGLAYFLTAVVVPLGLLFFNLSGGERFVFNGRGVLFATAGGIAGAAGALCIILSIKNGGKPLYIAPLVFAGAPIVNALVSLIWHPPAEATNPRMLPGWIMFGCGILLAAVGAGLVLYSKGYLDQKSKEAKGRSAPALAHAAPSAGVPLPPDDIAVSPPGLQP
jgi:hypothetical protein